MRSASTPRRSMVRTSGDPPRTDAEFGWLAANRIAADERRRFMIAAVEQERLLAEAGLTRPRRSLALGLPQAMAWLRVQAGAVTGRQALADRPKPSRWPLA